MFVTGTTTQRQPRRESAQGKFVRQDALFQVRERQPDQQRASTHSLNRGQGRAEAQHVNEEHWPVSSSTTG